MNLSIRQRLAVTYTVALAVMLSAAGFALVALHSRLSLSRLDRELGRLADTVSSVLQNELDEGLPPAAAAEDALSEVRAPSRGLVILTAQGATLAERWTRFHPALFAGQAAGERLDTLRLPDGHWRLLLRVHPPAPRGYAVAALAPLSEFDADRSAVLVALAMILPFAIALSVGGGWWVAGRALRPAARMAEQARQIGEHSPGVRLSIVRRDELGRLAESFNSLLGRLEVALEARRQFLADASHELRTPVSVARTAADGALGVPTRSNGDYREALAIVSTQMARLGRIIGDMLVLARGDSERWPLRRSAFYAEELAAECVRGMNVLAGERRVRIRLEAGRDLELTADEELLRQMLGNLLENAVRHTPPGDTVEVVLHPDDRVLAIDVHDHGPGIAVEDRERIFERFVRSGPADAEGTGLGLAIARRIARAHDGDVRLVSSGPEGTTFRATIPRE